MTSGGHARSGPPPDPTALRHARASRALDERPLPAQGRDGEPPAWPLSRLTARERVLWAQEWQRPQAVAWEALGLELEVALYVRNVAAAERPRASSTVRKLVMSQMDSLGITQAGLRRNRWVIADDAGPVAATADQTADGTGFSKAALLELVVNR